MGDSAFVDVCRISCFLNLLVARTMLVVCIVLVVCIMLIIAIATITTTTTITDTTADMGADTKQTPFFVTSCSA